MAAFASSAPGRRSPAFLLAFALAYAGGVLAYLPLLTLLLPMRAEAVAGEARLGLLTATVVAGAIAASLANIGFGWLSDRAVSRGGGRRPGMAVGIAALAIGCMAVAAAPSAPALVGAVALFQLGVNALLAPLLAIMADEVPDEQKGFAGGLLALGVPAASAISSVLVTMPRPVPAMPFVAIPVLVFALLLPLLTTRPRVAPVAPGPVRSVGRRDLLLGWTARLLVQVAGNALSVYIVFYAESVLPDQTAAVLSGRVAGLFTVAYLLAVPIALLVGRLSDRTGRPKLFLFAAAALAAAGLAAMAIAAGWAQVAVAFGVYAVGSAVFLALHAGFAMQLLPSPRHRARDLGLLNLANTLPALAGPLLAWLLATPRDFGPLLLTLAALTLAGGLVILGAQGRQ